MYRPLVWSATAARGSPMRRRRLGGKLLAQCGLVDEAEVSAQAWPRGTTCRSGTSAARSTSPNAARAFNQSCAHAAAASGRAGVKNAHSACVQPATSPTDVAPKDTSAHLASAGSIATNEEREAMASRGRPLSTCPSELKQTLEPKWPPPFCRLVESRRVCRDPQGVPSRGRPGRVRRVGTVSCQPEPTSC